MHKIFLDTDIGTDVDDLLAMSFILGSPDLSLLGITAAYGDTPLRAGLIREVLRRAGREDIPVAKGRSATFNGQREPWMAGHEGRNAGLAPTSPLDEDGSEAVELLLSTIEQNPGEVTLFAIAPLTNLALACQKAPDIMKKLKSVYLMGGVFNFNDPDLTQPRVEHNIFCDPEAAKVVFELGLPIKLFPLDVTLRTPLKKEDIDRIGVSNDPLRQFLGIELATWQECLMERFGHRTVYLHDPLTVAAFVDPAIVTRTLQARVAIECAGERTSGMTVPLTGKASKEHAHPVSVVVDVDIPRFYRLFVDTVTRFGNKNKEEAEIPISH